MGTDESEAEKFDGTVRKILSVSHKELQKREKTWKRKREREKEKRAKTSPASRVSRAKD
jgi:hypothetical protein